jgi:recombination protein RecT
MTEEKQVSRVSHVRGLVERRKNTLRDLMPEQVSKDRLLRVFQNALSSNTKLVECTDVSIITAIAKCGSFGLEPNTPLGQCHIIPYRNKRNGNVMEANFQMGYQGLIELARRAGTTITCGTVHENDTVIAREGLHSDFDIAYDIKKGRGAIIGVYAIAETREGNKIWKYMSVEDCEEHGKKFSQTYGKKDRFGNWTSPWQTDGPAMWLKTVIGKVCKYSPKAILAEWVSVESRGGINLDKVTDANAAIDDDDNTTFDVVATESDGEPANDLDAVAAKFEENEPAGSPPYDDTPEQSSGKPSRSELNQALLNARKSAKMTQGELDAEIIKQFGDGMKLGDLADYQVMTMIDVCNSK